MKAYQWFLLGMMVAWTPGLLALAAMLRRHGIGQDSTDTSNRHIRYKLCQRLGVVDRDAER